MNSGGSQSAEPGGAIAWAAKGVDRWADWLRENYEDHKRHAALIGPPGSGKDTIAPLTVQIYHDLGMIDTPEYADLTAGSLMGVNSGHSGEKIAKAFSKPRLVFVNEAGSLVGQDGWQRVVYDEVNGALTSKKFDGGVAMLAGHGYQLNRIFAKGDGLGSRIGEGNRFYLVKFTPDELALILLRDAAKNGIEIDREAFVIASQYIKRIARGENTSNPRTVNDCLMHWSSEATAEMFREHGIDFEQVEGSSTILQPRHMTPKPELTSLLAMFDADVTKDEVQARFEEQIYGQPHACERVAELLWTRAQLTAKTANTDKPIARLFMPGPSSAGKDHTLKVVATSFQQPEDVGKKDPPIYKVDLNTIHSLRDYLLGNRDPNSNAEPGLIAWMRDNPTGVIVFNEGDKGAQDAWNVVMEILDTGKYITPSGETLDFSNYVVAFLGNYGDEEKLHQRTKVDPDEATREPVRPGQAWGVSAAQNQDGVIQSARTHRITVTAEAGAPGVDLSNALAASELRNSMSVVLDCLRKNPEAFGLSREALDTKRYTVDLDPPPTQNSSSPVSLTVAAALVSQIREQAIPPHLAILGEVTAQGTIRGGPGIRDAVANAALRGVRTFVLPADSKEDVLKLRHTDGLRFNFVEQLDQALERIADEPSHPEKEVTVDPDIELPTIDTRVEAHLAKTVLQKSQQGRLSHAAILIMHELIPEHVRLAVRGDLNREFEAQLEEFEVTAKLTRAAEDELLELWTPDFGPRPIADWGQTKILAPLVSEIRSKPGDFPRGSVVEVTLDGSKASWTVTVPEEKPDTVLSDWQAELGVGPKTPVGGEAGPVDAPIIQAVSSYPDRPDGVDEPVYSKLKPNEYTDNADRLKLLEEILQPGNVQASNVETIRFVAKQAARMALGRCGGGCRRLATPKRIDDPTLLICRAR